MPYYIVYKENMKNIKEVSSMLILLHSQTSLYTEYQYLDTISICI